MTQQHPRECGTEAAEERAAIVALLRKMEADRLSRVGHIMSGGGRDYDIGRATGYGHAAAMIERGEHQPRQSDEMHDGK